MSLFPNQLIEIPLLLQYFSFMLTGNVAKNFLIYRTCYVSLGYNESDCVQLGTNNVSDHIKEIEEDVQPTAALIMMVHTVLNGVLPVFCGYIVGPWSNKHGRRPILMSSLGGMSATYLICMSITLIPWANPWWWQLTVITTSIGGGVCSMSTVAYCYVTDITTEKNRSIRMGILELCLGISNVFGAFASSYVFYAIGYSAVFGLCASLSFLAVLYTCFCLKESLPEVEKENKLRDIFDVSVIVRTIKVTFSQKWSGLLFLIMVILVVDVFVDFGEKATFFLFVREKFHWDLTQYTLFTAINNIIEIITAVIVLSILYKRFKIQEMHLILFAFILMCISSFIYAFATVDWEIYVGSALRRTNIALLPLARSAVSKLVIPEHIGCVFAFSTSLEMLNELISTPLYTVVYNSTLKTHPSAFNFLSAGVFVIGVITTGYVMYLLKLRTSNTNSDLDSVETAKQEE